MKKKNQANQELTRVFVHNGILGIQSSLKAPGLLNDPSQPGQLGFVVLAKNVIMSREVLDALAKVKRSHDAIGDVDIFNSNAGVIFSWLGGPLRMIDPTIAEGSREYDVKLLENVVIIEPNNPPQAFIDAVERQK